MPAASFAESGIKRSDQQFKKFVNAAFLQLRAQGIRNLIVDLRDNTGGTGSYAAYLTRYFFDRPFGY
jgi:C-terminal processing protease CtpA/Prc